MCVLKEMKYGYTNMLSLFGQKNLSMLRKKLWYTCHRIKLLEECYHIPYEHVQCNPMAEHLEISKYVRRKENVVLVEDTKLNLDVF